MTLIEKIENFVINKYGFEHPTTIRTFKVTEKVRKGKLYRYDISEMPFIPDVIDEHPVLCIHGNTAICG